MRKLPLLFVLAALAVLLIIIKSDLNAFDDYRQKRQRMVENDIRGRGIKDKRVLDAMSRIERHLFVDKGLMHRAYEDNPLPIDEGQTISQPYVVALMTEALRLKPTDRVLEIGTGSGYQAAVLAEIASEVYTIEIRKKLVEKSENLLKSLGYRNIKVKHADGYFGWEEHGPFDAIIVTASANHIPPPLIRQLKEGGSLIIPLGSTVYFQTLTLATKKKGELDVLQMTSVAFVPMTGEVQKKK
ncbi:MAG: protein-L-isoaspartate(D-aspartate) O-methyltransferase [Nitrospirae bacterium]|nr:protein-L-isoaspartate(D-aspartate) O-methyltransferase [Nitrospirota bacterium]